MKTLATIRLFTNDHVGTDTVGGSCTFTSPDDPNVKVVATVIPGKPGNPAKLILSDLPAPGQVKVVDFARNQAIPVGTKKSGATSTVVPLPGLQRRVFVDEALSIEVTPSR